MKKSLMTTIIIVLVVIVSIPSIFAQSESNEIPIWIKVIAQAWANDEINDSDYQNAMVFLIEHGIFKVNSTDTEFQIEQKNNLISILEKEVKDVGLDNSHLLSSIVEQENIIEFIENEIIQITNNFDDYKSHHSHKVGNIGGATINEDTIIFLQERIQELEQVIVELENEIQDLKNK